MWVLRGHATLCGTDQSISRISRSALPACAWNTRNTLRSKLRASVGSSGSMPLEPLPCLDPAGVRLAGGFANRVRETVSAVRPIQVRRWLSDCIYRRPIFSPGSLPAFETCTGEDCHAYEAVGVEVASQAAGYCKSGCIHNWSDGPSQRRTIAGRPLGPGFPGRQGVSQHWSRFSGEQRDVGLAAQAQSLVASG